MRVNSNNEPLNSDPVGVTRTVTQPAVRENFLGEDRVSLSNAEAINLTLEQTPDVRADKVAQAKVLIADISYPPLEIIQKISSLIGLHVGAQVGADH